VKKWDVVILRYPFTDLTATKARPALVVSPTSQCQGRGDDAIFIAISSNITDIGTFDVLLSNADPQFISTGLLFDSIIKVDKIFTLHKSLVGKTIGTLGPGFQIRVNTLLAAYFEIPAVASVTTQA
jgi:mRNA interferase MazF